MLRELYIKNYAIIDEIALSLTDGFNVITGETGAGKSILVGALSLLLGERSSLEGVRQGAEEAILEGDFDPIPSFPSDRLSVSDNLILKRVLSKSGKNRVYLNGGMAPLSSLKELGQKLAEIHGQQGQHHITNPDHQLSLLDAFCRHSDDRTHYKIAYRQWSRYCHELQALEHQSSEARRQKSIIEYQLSEIRDARLNVNEEEQLERDEHAMKHWESICSTTQSAYAQLSEDRGILFLLDEVGSAIRGLHEITNDASSEIDLWLQSKIHLKELAVQLRTRLQDSEFRPERLEEVAARLYKIQQIKKKYQRSVVEILDYQKQLENDLSDVSEIETRLQEVKKKITAIEKDLLKLGEALSEKRAKGKKALENKVEETLHLLGMEKTSFEISHLKTPLSENGLDQIEFLICLPGERPQSLGKIASGGELSRIMLAIKVVLAEVDAVPTLVFDEVDAGIGGGVAERVGRQLSALSNKHQVICITHLPQIASFADHHYFVEKKGRGNRFVTSIKELTHKEQVDELARMLGGVTITPLTRRHAEEMIATK